MEQDKSYMGFAKEINAFKSQNATQEDKSDLRFTLVYGFGFITMMFLGFLSGFAIGKVILQWDTSQSLILSVVIGTGTLFLETALLMIRLY